MIERKSYAIILAEDVAVELGHSFSRFIRNNHHDDYICAKAIEMDENYLHMTVDHELDSGAKVEVDLALPHQFVKGAISGTEADITELGFS